MAKSKRFINLIRDLKVSRYKWEFLRRNEEYQKAYAHFFKRFGGAWLNSQGEWAPSTSSEDDPQGWAFFRNEVASEAAKIMERWDITSPVDPSFSFDGSDGGPFVRPIFFINSMRGAKDSQPNPELLEPPLPEEEKKRILKTYSWKWDYIPKSAKELQFIDFQIDITDTLETIITNVESLVDEARARHRVQVGPLPESRKRPRKRLDHFDTYLLAWDLRKRNFTFEEIAFELFPREMVNRDYRSTVIKRVRSQFQRAQQLIDGDYRQIEG
jgi:hypothetical protein